MKNNHYYFLLTIPKMKILENNLFNFFLSLFIILLSALTIILNSIIVRNNYY